MSNETYDPNPSGENQTGDMNDPEEYGGLSVEDDPQGTVDPADVAGTAGESDEDGQLTVHSSRDPSAARLTQSGLRRASIGEADPPAARKASKAVQVGKFVGRTYVQRVRTSTGPGCGLISSSQLIYPEDHTDPCMRSTNACGLSVRWCPRHWATTRPPATGSATMCCAAAASASRQRMTF